MKGDGRIGTRYAEFLGKKPVEDGIESMTELRAGWKGKHRIDFNR